MLHKSEMQNKSPARVTGQNGVLVFNFGTGLETGTSAKY